MRYFFTTLLTYLPLALFAQNLPNIAIGVVQNNGNQEFISTPQSTIVVDLTLSTTRFVAGEYARYAQRYLGVRAALSDRVTTEIKNSQLSLAPQDFIFTPHQLPLISKAESYPLTLSADVTSADILTPEQRAQRCAEKIFAGRRLAKELISGDVGEGVFGAGLTSALELLQSQERECVVMFLGSEEQSTSSHRFVIPLKGSATRYMVCRFDAQNGTLLPANDIDGEAIYLQITPSAVQDSTYTLAVGKEPITRVYAMPNTAQCDLYVGANIAVTAELPIYEFGGRTTVIYDRK